jgi:hypothetical protein
MAVELGEQGAARSSGHGQAVIVPSPDAGYAELAGSGQAARFRKHLLTLHQPFVNPASGQVHTLDEQTWHDLERNFRDRVSLVTVPLATRRTSNRSRRGPTLARWLERHGNKIYSVVEIRRPSSHPRASRQ